MSAPAKAHYFGRTALLGLFRSPFIHSVSIATIAVSLFAAGLTWGAVRWVDGLIRSLDAGAQMTVYLKRDASPELKPAILARIRERGGEAKVVTPEAALLRLAGELDRYGEVLQRLPKNPLPWSIEAYFAKGVRDPGTLHRLADELKTNSGVDEVDYGAKALERLSAVSNVLRLGGTGAFAIVLLMTITIV